MYFQQQGKFQPLDQVVLDSEYPSCPLLLKCADVKQYIHHITEEKGEKKGLGGKKRLDLLVSLDYKIDLNIAFCFTKQLRMKLKLYFKTRSIGLEVVIDIL